MTDLSDAHDRLPFDQEPTGAVRASSCTWSTEGAFDSSYWWTSCGNYLEFTDGGSPKDHDFKFCPFCANRIRIEAAA